MPFLSWQTSKRVSVLQNKRNHIDILLCSKNITFLRHSVRYVVDCAWKEMVHAQIANFPFRRNRQVHLNRCGRRFSRPLAAEVCASAVVMLDRPCCEIVWRVLATHSIRQFPLHFPTPCVTVCHHVSTGLYELVQDERAEGFVQADPGMPSVFRFCRYCISVSYNK